MYRLITAAACLAILAGCGSDPQGDQAQAPGNQLMPSAESRSAGLGEPIGREQAVALMKERHDNYEKIGDAMKVISRELKGDSPDLEQVRRNADVIATFAPQVPGWFPPGSGPEVGKTEAKAEIWQKPEDFTAKARAFEQAAKAFQAAASGTDLAVIRAAHGELGKSCKACHDLYREDH